MVWSRLLSQVYNRRGLGNYILGRGLALGAARTAEAAAAAELPLGLGAVCTVCRVPIGAVRMPLLALVPILPALAVVATIGFG